MYTFEILLLRQKEKKKKKKTCSHFVPAISGAPWASEVHQGHRVRELSHSGDLCVFSSRGHQEYREGKRLTLRRTGNPQQQHYPRRLLSVAPLWPGPMGPFVCF